MRTARLLLPMIIVVFDAAGCSQSTPFKPVMTVKELMHATVQPMSNDVFDAAVWINGIPSGVPTNDEEWEEVKDSALTLAEAGNLLMMAPRARDTSSWMARAQEMIDAAVGAAKACDSKDLQTMFRAGGRLAATCDACHNLYPPPDVPEANTRMR